MLILLENVPPSNWLYKLNITLICSFNNLIIISSYWSLFLWLRKSHWSIEILIARHKLRNYFTWRLLSRRWSPWVGKRSRSISGRALTSVGSGSGQSLERVRPELLLSRVQHRLLDVAVHSLKGTLTSWAEKQWEKIVDFFIRLIIIVAIT